MQIVDDYSRTEGALRKLRAPSARISKTRLIQMFHVRLPSVRRCRGENQFWLASFCLLPGA